MSAHICVIAVENSGDQLGAALVKSISSIAPDTEISGIGGPAMADVGVTSDIDISSLSVLGFVEALKVYPLVLKRVRETVCMVMDSRPDAVVLIDSWGFMIRVAQGLKRAGYKGQIIKYVAPQVWAMREGRAKILAKSVDHLLAIHSFDAPYFTLHGLATTHVGNPVFDQNYRVGDKAAFCATYNLDPDRPVLGLFYGSRRSEIERLATILTDAAARVAAQTDAQIIAPIADNIDDGLNRLSARNPGAEITRIPQSAMVDAMAAMDAAISVSGTVTTQLADAGVPTVVAYKLAPLTYFAAKRLFQPDYISIVNIAAGQALMPEFIQNDATAEDVSAAVIPYLTNETARAAISNALQKQTDAMKGKGGLASAQAASKILELLSY